MPPQQSAVAVDPFAALSGSSLTPSKPSTPAQQSQPAPPAAAAASNEDDEWSFSSALPPETPSHPREHRAVVSNGGIKIELLANRSTSNGNPLNLVFAFSNNTAQPVSDLHYQLAVTKVTPLRPHPSLFNG